VRNPLRSEEEAYRFLLVTIGVAAVIVIASLLGGFWVGSAVAVLAIAAVVWMYWRQPTARPPVRTESRATGDTHCVLVVANETVGGPQLREEIRRRAAAPEASVLVVCPALNSPLRHWASDDDRARAQAKERLDLSLSRLAEEGVDARGEIGDGDPLQAIEDALRTFGAEEIVISTHPEGRSNWLEQGVVSGARARFAVPVTHVVVDLEREGEGREELRGPDPGTT
jgi:hypothetical protein